MGPAAISLPPLPPRASPSPPHFHLPLCPSQVAAQSQIQADSEKIASESELYRAEAQRCSELHARVEVQGDELIGLRALAEARAREVGGGREGETGRGMERWGEWVGGREM
jgi:hypothetical protein